MFNRKGFAPEKGFGRKFGQSQVADLYRYSDYQITLCDGKKVLHGPLHVRDVLQSFEAGDQFIFLIRERFLREIPMLKCNLWEALFSQLEDLRIEIVTNTAPGLQRVGDLSCNESITASNIRI